MVGMIYLSLPHPPLLHFGRDNSAKQSFYFMFSFFLVPFKILQKMWTGGQVVKILRKQFQHYWFNHLKVWTVDKKLAFYFMFSFCPSTFRQNLFESVDMRTKRCLSISYFLSVMQPSQFWQKSVDRWTINENSKKSFNLLYFIAWKCGLVEK